MKHYCMTDVRGRLLAVDIFIYHDNNKLGFRYDLWKYINVSYVQISIPFIDKIMSYGSDAWNSIYENKYHSDYAFRFIKL